MRDRRTCQKKMKHNMSKRREKTDREEARGRERREIERVSEKESESK